MISENKKCSECGRKQIRGEDMNILINDKQITLPTYNFIFASICGDVRMCQECLDKFWKDGIKTGVMNDVKEV